MNNDKYVSPVSVSKKFSVTSGTLRRWAEEGKIRYLRPNEGRRIYHIDDITKIFGIKEPVDSKQTICYARVSSQHQKQDLERQIKLLEDTCPGAKIIKDIGSGLNWRRPGFNTLLESINKGLVGTVVVTYRDRLCRFGFELLEWVFKKANVKLVVLNKGDEEGDPTKELSEDLLAITTIFVAKNNGLRAGKYRRERKRKEEETKEEKE